MGHFYKKSSLSPLFPKCLFLPVTGRITFRGILFRTFRSLSSLSGFFFFLPSAKAGKYWLFSCSVWCPGRGGCLCVGVLSTVAQPVSSGTAILSDFSSFPRFVSATRATLSRLPPLSFWIIASPSAMVLSCLIRLQEDFK